MAWDALGLPIWIVFTVFNLLTSFSDGGGKLVPAKAPAAVVAPAADASVADPAPATTAAPTAAPVLVPSSSAAANSANAIVAGQAPQSLRAPAAAVVPAANTAPDAAGAILAAASTLVASGAAAAELEGVTGRWDGTWEGAYGQGRIVLVLVQKAGVLTGTAAIQGASLFSAEPQAIVDGRISDRGITFALDGVAGRIEATATTKAKDAWGTFSFRGAPYRFSVVRQ